MTPSQESLMTVRTLREADRAGQTPFASVLLVKKISARTARNDAPFLMLELADRTGGFTCTCFSDHPGFDVLSSLREGAVLRVQGRVEYYQNRLSPKILQVETVGEDDLTPELLESLVETAPEDAGALWRELQEFVAGIVHPDLRATLENLFGDIGDAFRVAPAAVAMHHAYRHGLLEHTVRMARAGRKLLPLYPEVHADLAMAGILAHDAGKTVEYEGTLAIRRSRRGILQGHVVLGYQLVRKAGLKARLAPDLLERLEHIVLSHQGEMEWGAAALAATPEAVFVSMIDNLDAKMGMVQRALRQAGGTAEFSERLPGLNSPLLIEEPRTEQAASEPRNP